MDLYLLPALLLRRLLLRLAARGLAAGRRLLRVALRSCCAVVSGGRGVAARGHIRQAVLHEADFHAAATGALHLAVFSLQRGIAHADGVNAIQRNVMV